MTAVRDESLWAMLVTQGLASGEQPPRSEHRSPWYVRVMLGIAGWIGALFLLSFVGVMFVFVMQHALAAIAVGALACAGASVIFRSRPKGDFAAQFGLAISIVGQLLIAYGLAKWFDTKLWPVALVMAAVQAVLFIVIPNFVHRVWVAWTGVFAVALALGDVGWHALALPMATVAFAWVWVREFDFGARAEILRAGGYGLALACMQLTFMHGDQFWSWLHKEDGTKFAGDFVAWLGVVLSAAALLWTVVLLLKREGVPLDSHVSRIALAGAAILSLACIKAPGVGPAAAILIVGYANGNRVLAGLGILALLGYLSQYYYALHATLLEKSIILACTGFALLLIRLLLHRWWPQQPKEISRA